MAQHFLNDAQVGAVGEQVAGEGVAQRVRRNIRLDAGLLSVKFKAEKSNCRKISFNLFSSSASNCLHR